MPTDAEKSYAKKHKLNELLNELYLELVQTKPDNPIEHAIKHFEAKLPPKEKKSSLLDFKIIKAEPNLAEPENDLIAKLFNKKNFLGVGTDQGSNISSMNPSNANQSFSNALTPFINVNIMNKINRIIVKTNKELSNEEILDKENIVYVKKKEDLEDESIQESKMIINYKNDLKNRELVNKHKQELKRLIENANEEPNEESELINQENLVGEFEYKKPSFEKLNDSDLNEELEEEILTSRNNYRTSSVKKENKTKKNKNRKSAINSQQNRQNALITPVVKMIICEFCSKIQNNLIKEEDDFSKKEYMSVYEKNSVSSQKLELEQTKPAEQTSDQNMGNEDVSENVDQLKVEKSIFDFFSKNLEKNTNQQDSETFRKVDNFEDEIIESASQVSGPRKIEHYQPVSTRTESKPEEKKRDVPKDTGILAWIMSNQKLSQELNKQSKDKESVVSKTKSESNSTLVGSKTKQLDKKNTSPRLTSRNASDISTSSKNQKWKLNLNSSNSDLFGQSKKS